ncbi:ABC transporter substrate-binding protein [Pelomonas sp. APW6]|uniref:ABC transporter substrate-binding protein n=1 Tax=Roseateles subflavus TaxID=3053353 RepID=A0ABT7LEV0_9BURK|nr:ABC transporter substrate-binding protein [Pelomonas sp. APW6]MDL5030999.1 ABC transporter substrate-binding protein [Pelomonas sp. APW6]
MVRAFPRHPDNACTRRHCLRRGGAALASLVGASMLAGCQPPPPLLRVGCIVFPGYELIVLARELGLLPPSRVRLIEMRNNTDTLHALATAQLEAACLTLDELLTARGNGLDLRVIAVLDSSAGADALMARPGLGDLRALAGQRIGTEDSASGALMLGAALSAAGLALPEVRKVPMSLDRSVELYRSGAVDAVVTAEPWASLLEKQGARRLFDSRSIPDRIVDVLAVRAEAIQGRPEALRALLRGHFAALHHLRQQPQDAARLMAPRLSLRPEEVAAAFQGLILPDAARNREMLAPEGSLARSARQLVRLLLDQGLMATPPSMNQWLDPRFLPED